MIIREESIKMTEKEIQLIGSLKKEKEELIE